jgi:DNA-binding NtrC family response regulator
MKRILIVDDEIEMLESFKKLFSHKPNFKVTVINEPLYAKTVIQQETYDLLITDLKMKNFSGLDLLKLSKKFHPDFPVILISGYGTIESSVEAMKYGASDFIEKPFTSQKLFDCIDKSLKKSKSKTEATPAEMKRINEETGLIYKSKKMENIVEMIQKIASTNINVLITGESGTGKEVLARAVHKLSKSNSDPFVPVNCGALPESLFESELFGHEKGAFTGAIKTKPGLLEFANHGTFFLDEIGEMTLPLQVKLLRMLEERKIRRVGGQEEIDIDVRIIAASNRDLQKAVTEGNFREDLYYRLCTFQIEVPPLRERTEDIMPLANHFLQEVCRENGNNEKIFSPEVEEFLMEYYWPGNIRELHNIVGRTYFLSGEQVITKNELPLPLIGTIQQSDLNTFQENYSNAKEKMLENFEIEYLTFNLKKNYGNVSKTAEQCGMDRRTVHRLIKKYNILYKDRLARS